MHRLLTLLLAVVTGLSLAGLAGGTSSVAKLKIAPAIVPRGGVITVTGTGFRPYLRVTLRIGRPNASTTAKLGTVKATAKGAFRFRKTIARSTGAGLWVVRACQSSCRTKATAQFRVAKVKPL